jgi:hypothetical protein
MRAFLAVLTIAAALGRAERAPVLVELFTSEGCSSCPPADQLLQKLDSQVFVLSEHVDYWDRLGWRDPFSSPVFTARQERYARALGAETYTPQMVIDGREQALGNDPAAVQKAIARAAARPKAPLRLTVASGVVTVGFAGNGELWIAVADDSAVSNVTRGENQGRTLPHVAVVRTLKSAGKLNGVEKTVRVEAGEASRIVAFVTDGSGRVIAISSARTSATRN